MTVHVRDIQVLLDSLYDPATAESWDSVGLVCGRPDAEVRRIHFAVDVTPSVVAEAVALEADLLVTHHPLFLRGVHSVAATTPKGRMVHDLISHGVALFNAHTNADTPAHGVNEALARAVGIVDPRVALPDDQPGLDKIVVFVPSSHTEAVRQAMSAAGGGRLAAYDSCSFTTTGEGRFRPLPGASPSVGSTGELAVVPEDRVEMVVDRADRRAVVAAMLAAHPYEVPAYDVIELANGASAPSRRGAGRIGELPGTETLRTFVSRVARVLPATAQGVRVSGDLDRPVHRVVVSSGAGDFMLDDVLGMEADVYLTSDLRHHRALEFVEHGGPALVDVSHWAAEWTWLPLVEERLLALLTDGGDTVDTHLSTIVTDPWTVHVNSPGVE